MGADFAIDYSHEDFAAVVLEKTGSRGVDVVFDGVGEAVMERSMACTAYNGRYLAMGFASGKRFADEPLIVPRRLATGNFKMCGVLLAYANEAVIPAMKQGMGWNFCPSPLGSRIMAEIVDRVRRGEISPVVGEVVGFEDLPQALARMRDRQTMGRVLVVPG